MANALGDGGLRRDGRLVRPARPRSLHRGRGDRVLHNHETVLDVSLAARDATSDRKRIQPLHDTARVVVLGVHVPGAQREGAGAAAVRLAAALAPHQTLQPAKLVTRPSDPAAAGASMTLTFCECRFNTCSSLGLVRVQMASVSV